MIVHKPECQMQRDNVLPCSCGAVWTAAMLLAQERPVSSQLQRIENGLDLLLQGQTALEQQIEKLGTKLTSWLAEEAIAADILKKTRELQKHNAKHHHTPAMRARAALRMAKRRTSTNRGSK